MTSRGVSKPKAPPRPRRQQPLRTSRAAPGPAPLPAPLPPTTTAMPAAAFGQSGREGVVAAAVGFGAVLVIALWWHDTPGSSLRPLGARLTAAGQVTGLVGTYLVIVEVLLMSRIPWLDRLIG